VQYRCEAQSVEGFVQQLAANLVNKGYRFYFAGRIPDKKNPAAVDAKLIEHYGLGLSKFQRARRKKNGHASVAYLRHGRLYVLLATAGHHKIFSEHAMRDVRREPLVCHGYSIGCGKGSDGKHHASVKIEAGAFDELLAYFTGIAAHRSAETLAAELQRIRFEPYARVRRQLLRLLREVNTRRLAAGFDLVPFTALRLRRVVVKVFGEAVGDRATGTEKILIKAFVSPGGEGNREGARVGRGDF
jgi:hypothetical protein